MGVSCRREVVTLWINRASTSPGCHLRRNGTQSVCCQVSTRVRILIRPTKTRNSVFVVRRLLLAGSLLQPAKSVFRRTSPQLRPQELQGPKHRPSSGACKLTYTTKSKTGGSGSCPIRASCGHQKKPLQDCMQRRIIHIGRGLLLKSLLPTIRADPQHKVTACMQGQSSSVFIRQLHCVTEFAKVRQGERNVHHRFFGPPVWWKTRGRASCIPNLAANEARNL